MRTFGKSSKLDHVSYDVRGPVLQEADKMQSQGVKILKLNIGNPAPFGFETPEELIRVITENLHHAEGYSDSKGIVSARQAIADYCRKKNISNVDINDIYTGNGVSELTLMSMQALLDHGDEVLVPAPDYPLWTAAVTLAGGKAVHYICDEQADWNPDIDDLKKKITKRAKAIIIINPNNPTGALYPQELLQQIVELARQHELIIFADEIYDRLVMDGREHISIASLAPDLFMVTFNGLSKSDNLCGFRCGWMSLSGDKSKARGYIEGLNMLSSMRLCANVPAQFVVQTALENYKGPHEALLPGGRLYEQRNFVYEALNNIPGISAVKPKAGLYIFPKINTKKFNIKDDEKFVLDFLHQQHVLVVHGRGFNWINPDHFRVVFLPKLEELKLAMDKLRSFLANYHQA